MFRMDSPVSCSLCDDGTACDLCVLCLQWFCVRHRQVHRGMSTCEACMPDRIAREAHVPQSLVDSVRVGLMHDLVATLDDAREADVREAATRVGLIGDESN